ncbi:recombinase family protein [Hymenobacter sp. NBH84]|uniref:recombinase family protein n=1 Tax=Hymenobacter sp. NBH84 TaxID=2596915 RepID=UPI001627BCB2|nr:recombinase family protein [Hymenobacter sp. NBH84]
MRVAIYARVSTRDKGQDTENQLRELRGFAERLGYSVYKEYTDQESKAKADWPAFKQLFQDAHQRRFDVVLLRALDRFSREGVAETLGYLQNLSVSGVQFKSFTEQYLDNTGIFKDAIISILATIAKQERVRLSERTKAGLAKTLAKGTVLGAPTKSISIIEQVQALKATGVSNQTIQKPCKFPPIQWLNISKMRVLCHLFEGKSALQCCKAYVMLPVGVPFLDPATMDYTESPHTPRFHVSCVTKLSHWGLLTPLGRPSCGRPAPARSCSSMSR